MGIGFFVFIICFLLASAEIGDRLHHSNYRVSHHMGKMKIKANPEGADFDFSGGDLHVDLHPAHSDIVPIYNYFHSDYHEYHVQPVEHHVEHEHLSGDEDHDLEHHGEDEEGYTRSFEHHHDHHNHYNLHQGDAYEHQHMHHHRYHDNDERHHDMHHDEHHSGDHQDHHMGHHEHHHMNEHEEIAADHGHHDMPHVFPVGMWQGGEGHHGGGMHNGGGGHGGGGYGGGGGGGYGGGGHGGYGGEGGEGGGMHHGNYGGHVEMTGNHQFHPGNIHHNREEQWGHNMGNMGGGDYGGCKRNNVDGNCTAREEETENGEQRDFLIKPIGLKGSIREKFKKHWDEEDKEEGEFTNSHDEVDDDIASDDADDDKVSRVTRHHHRHHVEEKEPSKPDDDGKPTSEEFMRVYNYAKKIYPGEDDSSGGGEKVEPTYKINDKLSAREEQLAKDIERMEALRKSKKRKEKKLLEKEEKEREYRERKRRRIRLMEKKLEKEKEEKRKEDMKYREILEKESRKKHEKEKEEEISKDDVEKDIESREKEIQKDREKAYGSIDKAESDNDSEDKPEKSEHKPGELRWDKDVMDSKSDHSPSHKSEFHDPDETITDEEKHHDKEEDKYDEDRDHDKDEDEDEDKSKNEKEEKYEDDMDEDEKRQHDFHDSISHMRPKTLHSLERPHEGIEKFGGKDEEVDINDKTHEGDIDQMETQQRLEEGKNELPIQDSGEGEQLKELAQSYTPPVNAKPETDQQQSSMYEQNQDTKLEGSDHQFYHDRSNYAAMHDEDQGKRHDLNLLEPVKLSGSNADITESPHNEEDVDKKVLGDFKSRFNEETSFQSVEQAEELFNQLQDAASTNQKKLDGQQTTGSVTDNGLVSANLNNLKHPMFQNHAATKRHKLEGLNAPIYQEDDKRRETTKLDVEKRKRQSLLFSKFFVTSRRKPLSHVTRSYKIYSKRDHAYNNYRKAHMKRHVTERKAHKIHPAMERNSYWKRNSVNVSVRIPIFKRGK